MIRFLTHGGIRIGAGVAMLLALTSCVTKGEFVQLSYSPEKEAEQEDDGRHDLGRQTQTACSLILSVADERADKGRIGRIAGGLVGESVTPIFTDSNVEAWVHDAIVLELQRLGVGVSEAADRRNDTAVGMLSVTISEVSTGCYAIICSASVHLSTTLTSQGGDMQTSEQNGKGSKAGVGFSYVPVIEEALRRSLRDAVNLTIDDLNLPRTQPCQMPGITGNHEIPK